jgi:hypothetical protein
MGAMREIIITNSNEIVKLHLMIRLTSGIVCYYFATPVAHHDLVRQPGEVVGQIFTNEMSHVRIKLKRHHAVYTQRTHICQEGPRLNSISHCTPQMSRHRPTHHRHMPLRTVKSSSFNPLTSIVPNHFIRSDRSSLPSSKITPASPAALKKSSQT